MSLTKNLTDSLKTKVIDVLQEQQPSVTPSEIKTIASICLAEAMEEQITDWGDDTKRDLYIKDIELALQKFNVDAAFENGGWNILFRNLTQRLAGFSKNARDSINQVPDAEQCKAILGYNANKGSLTPFNVNSSNMSLQTSKLVGSEHLGEVFGNDAADGAYKQMNHLHEGKCYICDKFL